MQISYRPLHLKIFILFLLLILNTSILTSYEIKVRILTKTQPKNIQVIPYQNSTLIINNKEIKSPVSIYSDGKNKIKVKYKNKTSFINGELNIKINGYARVKIRKGRVYKGNLIITSQGNYLKIINKLDLEDYVLATTNAETKNMKNIEAIKANSIAIRTYSLVSLNRHIREGYNLCDLTHCQLYTGFENIREIVKKAVRETEGIIMVYKNKPIWALYHANCGSRTENAKDVWGYKTTPYLKSVEDSIGNIYLCSHGRRYRWITKISKKRFEEFLRKKITGSKEKFTDIKVISHTKSGRAKELEIITNKNKKIISAIDFYHIIGRSLGWLAVKSTFFEIEKESKYIIFKGRGYGHGVGLCQEGADTMGELGYTYIQILKHYYKGIKLVKYMK